MSEMHHEQEAPIRAYLSYYIDGAITSAWQNFPTISEEMEYNLGRSGIEAEHLVGILDTLYETEVPGLDRRLPRHPDLNELNHLAILIDEMDEGDHATFQAVIEAGGHWDSMDEIINAAMNLDRFDYFPGSFSEKEFGGIVQEMHGDEYAQIIDRLRASDNPQDRTFAEYVIRLEASADLEKYGQLAMQAEGGFLTSVGYLIPLDENLPQKYTGPQDIPSEHLVTSKQDAPEHKPSLLGQLAAAKAERNTADAVRTDLPEKKAPSGPEL